MEEALVPMLPDTCQVSDLMPPDFLGRLTFDARDRFRTGYDAAVVAVKPCTVDIAVMMAAIQCLLSADLKLLVIVSDRVDVIRRLLAMGEQNEMLAVLQAIESGFLEILATLDVAQLQHVLDRVK